MQKFFKYDLDNQEERANSTKENLWFSYLLNNRKVIQTFFKYDLGK